MARANMLIPYGTMTNPLGVHSSMIPESKYVGKFCVDDNDKMYRIKEIDGNSWESVIWTDSDNPVETGEHFYDIYYLNNKFFIVGTNVRYSTDGINWHTATGITLDTGKYIYSVAYGNGKYVCVGMGGYFYYSFDGETWMPATDGINVTPSYPDTNRRTYYAITYGNGRFVCVANRGSSYGSTDGITWTKLNGLRAYKDDAQQYETYFQSIAYGHNCFVCSAGYGLVYRLEDNSNMWVLSNTGITEDAAHTINGMNEICFGQNRFVGVGDNSKTYYSLDGITWAAMNNIYGGYKYNASIYGNGRFVAVGRNGYMCYSLDGISWLRMNNLPIIDPLVYRSATYTNDCIYVIRSDGQLYKTTPNGGVYVYYPLKYSNE